MKVLTKKIKLFGVTETYFQVVDENGKVLRVENTKEEAEKWMKDQQS